MGIKLSGVMQRHMESNNTSWPSVRQDPQFLFVVGPPRSGTTLLAALLDDHPDILVFPLEWVYFTRWWYRRTAGAARFRVGDLEPKFLRSFGGIVKGVHRSTYSEFRFGEAVDSFRLLQCMEDRREALVTPEEYLRLAFEAYHKAHSHYRHRQPRYYALKCMLHGIDWSDDEFVTRQRFLFTFRNTENRYRSVKAKFLEKNRMTLYQGVARSGAYLAYMKHAKDVYHAHKHLPNFHTICLKDLQRQPNAEMARVAEYLGVPFAESLTRPTFCGSPFGGHFHESELNRGTILARESEYDEITSFEKFLLNHLKFEDLEPREPEPGSRMDGLRAVSVLLRTALFELRPPRGASRRPRRPVRDLVNRVGATIALFRSYRMLRRLTAVDLSRMSYPELNRTLGPYLGKATI